MAGLYRANRCKLNELLHVHDAKAILSAHPCVYRPYSHKLLTINNYVNCPSNFVFARSIYLFHTPIFEKILMRIRSINFVLVRVCVCTSVCTSVTMFIEISQRNALHTKVCPLGSKFIVGNERE